MQAQSVPGTGWYVAAGAAALAGIAGAVAVVASFVFSMGEPARFLAPGRGEVEVPAPARYILWHEYRTVFENRTYQSEPELPGGVRFTILAPDGSAVQLEPAGSQTWDSGDVQRRAVGQFEARAAGRYTISLEGNFTRLVIAVAPDFALRMLAMMGGAFLIAVLGVGAGIGAAVYAFGLRSDAERKAAPADPGPAASPAAAVPADAERALREMVALVYALQAASFVVGVTLIAGVIIDYLKRDEAAGTWLESHVRWQIRTFWWTFFWTVLGVATLVVLVGIAILLAAGIWFVYRVVKGWTELRAGRPVGAG